MRVNFPLTIVFTLLLLSVRDAGEALHAHRRISLPRDTIYVDRGRGHQAYSIILRPDRTMLYGSGGRDGTKHLYFAGNYCIQGNMIIFYELNGGGGNQHETYLPFSAQAIGSGSETYWRRLR